MSVENVRVGTSGWNYPTGRGTWNGVFYPHRRGRPKTFDELAYYAEHFDTVEVNSTFYGQPRADVTRAWVERTPPGFEFSVKLYQKFTHPRMFEDRVRRSLGMHDPNEAMSPGRPDRGQNEAVVELARPNDSDLDEFRRGIEPLAASGRLGALLAQFPSSFKNTNVGRAYLADLLRALSAYPVAVELRHRSWSDAWGETIELLNGAGAAWVQIDEPKFRFSIQQNYLPNVRGFYYMRLHGRNAAKWWKHDKSEDRYDYLYSAEELKEFTEVADAAKTLVKKLSLDTKNHFSAKSVANAAMIKRQLGEPLEGEYPDEFVVRYPELEGVVRTPSATARGLFVDTSSERS
jgi:uncharacterized protein YecE (DUF72 family)